MDPSRALCLICCRRVKGGVPGALPRCVIGPTSVEKQAQGGSASVRLAGESGGEAGASFGRSCYSPAALPWV
jgi:hypothetical protein